MDQVQPVKEPDNTFSCKNCGHHFTGKFCNHCGQRADTERLTAKEILHDLLHAVTHMDKGYFYSVRQLILRPGHAVREYLEGKRVDHSNPFLMLLIIGTLGSFLYDKYEVASLNSIKIHDLQDNFHIIASKFFALATLVYSFIFAFCDFIFFRYKKYYYSELYVFNIFQMVAIMVLNLLLLPLWIKLGSSAAGDYARIVVYLFIIAYLVFVRYQFFNVKADQRAGFRLLAETGIFLLLLLIIGGKTIFHIFQNQL